MCFVDIQKGAASAEALTYSCFQAALTSSCPKALSSRLGLLVLSLEFKCVAHYVFVNFLLSPTG